MTDIEKELEKVKCHIRLIGETINSESDPIPSLVIKMDWDDDDLKKARVIFEKYDNALKNEESVNWTNLESELYNTFNIDYQIVKSIILAFFRNHEWTEVCIQYAQNHDVYEFREILRSDT